MQHPNERFMRLAIDLARSGTDTKDPRVGAIVVLGDSILGKGTTTVVRENDPTCHAEMNAIRQAARKINSRFLDQCVLYTTLEPCPMCTAAAIWAKMRGVVFGANRNDCRGVLSWRIRISASDVIVQGTPRLELYENFLREECLVLLQDEKDNKPK